MKMRTTSLPCKLFLVAMLSLAGWAVRADEPPHRAFVQGLREKGYTDLALQYLEGLSKKPTPEQAKWLPLELAKTRLDLARDESDPSKRADLFAKARTEFETFINGNKGDPRVAEASLELARSVGYQAKAILAKGMSEESPETRKVEMTKARTQFEEAAKSLLTAAKELDLQLAKYENPQTAQDRDAKRDLTQARLQAELEMGLNLLDQSQTFDDIAEAAKRGEIVKKGGELLAKLGAKDEAQPICWQARAWRGKCFQEIDDPTSALVAYDKIINETNNAAETAKRLAKYFRLQLIDKDPKYKGDPLAQIVIEGEKWRETYRAYLNSPEGNGVRYHLAEAYKDQALRIPKPQQGQAKAQELYTKAEKLYEELEKSENEFTKKARERKLNVIIQRSGERAHGDITKLVTFQECYLRAQSEIAFMADEAKKAKEGPVTEQQKVEEKRQQHYQNMIVALHRALDLATDATPVNDRSDARYILGYAYLKSGDPYRAALVSEDLARSNSKSNRASTAAAYALQAYTQILADEESAGRDKFLAGDRDRLRKLAEFMEKTWPTDSATDFARHQLGMIAIRNNKLPEAIAVLARISPTYGGYTISQFQLASAAIKADKEKIDLPKGQPTFLKQAAAALTKIPDLPNNADASTTQFFVYARLELAKILFADRQFAEMEKLVGDLVKRFPDLKPKLDKAVQDELQPTITNLPLYVKFGLADTAFRANNFPDVVKMLAPVVADLRDKKIEARDPQMLRGMLGLALRANVQVGNKKEAREILEILQKTAGTLEGGASAILVDLVQQLRKQIEELKQRGEGAKAELEKTVASYSGFLDELANQPAKNLTPEIIRFLAFSYSGLEKHKEAASLLVKIPKPDPSKDPDPAKKAEEDKKNEQFYHSVRLLFVRELRLGKDFAKAEETLNEIMGTEGGRKSIDAKKEKNFLLQDQEKWALAFKGWDELMKTLKPLINDARFKETYYECYYYLTFSYYKYATKLESDDKKKTAIKKAAGFITKLESSKPDMGGEMLKNRYMELLKQEAALKEAYEEGGGKVLLAKDK